MSNAELIHDYIRIDSDHTAASGEGKNRMFYRHESSGSSGVYTSKIGAMALSAAAAFPIIGSGELPLNPSLANVGSERAELSTTVNSRQRLVQNFRTVPEAISKLKDIFSLSMTDISIVMRVQRPTVYQWLSGVSPRPASLKRLNEIYNIAVDAENQSWKVSRTSLNLVVQGSTTLLNFMAKEKIDKSKLLGYVEELSSKSAAPQEHKSSLAQLLSEQGFSKLSEADQQRNIELDGPQIGENISG